MADAPPGLLAGAIVLVPVPLHRGAAARRGFNQAEELAAASLGAPGLPVARLPRRAPGAAGRPRSGRGRGDRLAALGGRHPLRRRAGAAAALLVDDVVTTGATLAACAAALRAAGCREVRAVAYARTPGR